MLHAHFFSVAGDGQSLLDPEGRPFWSMGVCCVDPGPRWSKYKLSEPEYCADRLFVSRSEWADDTAQKLRSWGVNTLGGWSDVDSFRRLKIPYTVVLHLGAYDQAPWHDLFAPTMKRAIEDAAKKQIQPIATDPSLIGYFTDNELGWWDETIFKVYFGFEAATPGKQALIDLMRRWYRGDLDRLTKDWDVSAISWSALKQAKRIFIRPRGQGQAFIRRWMQCVGERYYGMVRDAVRRNDRNHLILGDRYCQYYCPAVASASRRFIDVCSINFGATWRDGRFPAFFFDSLHTLTGKPILVSEWYMTAIQNRSGNKNSSGGFPVVISQEQRAIGVHNYLAGLRRRPYIVGAHWFQFYDEPSKGRGDGENYNMGLVDIDGRPYDEVVAQFTSFSKYGWCDLAQQGAFREPIAWPYELAMKARTPTPVAELAIERKALASTTAENSPTPFSIVHLIAMDYADESLYRGGRIPESERSMLRLKLNGKVIDIRFGGKGRRATCSDPTATIVERAGIFHQLSIRIAHPMANGAARLALHGGKDVVEWRF